MKIYLETMGCQMNRLDSELVISRLRAAGHEMTDDRRSADVVLFNTCSVRRHAEQKVYSRLGAEGQRKAHNRRLIVGVLGCMAQREGEQLLRDYPQVDIVCSPGQLARLAELVEHVAGGGGAVLAMDPDRRTQRSKDAEKSLAAELAPRSAGERPAAAELASRSAGERPAAAEEFDALDLSRDPSQSPSFSQAFVRVARGCDKFCTYCIVPFVRGPEVSRAPQRIVDEVRRLVEAGRSEITLLGQTVNSYRWSDGGRSVNFADLLGRLAAVGGLRRLRFVTSHPLDFGDDILQAMRDLPNVCPYIHCPAQSGSDAVLRRMNRKYTRAQYDDLVDRARTIVPDVVLAGDFIVGFPGESEEDHAASAQLIRRSGYKNSFIFKYSPRPGTAAARMHDDVPAEVKRRRNNELLDVQAEVGLAHHRSYIGRTVEVLVEGPSPRAAKQPTPAPPGQTQMLGRTRGDHIVVFDGPPALAGQYISVRIVDASALTLMGIVD